MDAVIEPNQVEIDRGRPLLIVDVDEVLGLFIHGFGRFLVTRGYELRMDRFALFQNIFAPEADEHLDLEAGQALFDDFFRFACGDMEPAPGAVDALAELSKGAGIVALTNAPDHAREPRTQWMTRNGMDYPLLINSGPKGRAVAALAARTERPVAFVDDLLGNLESVASEAPTVHRFQMVADPRLRGLAPTAPDRHPRIDDWVALRLEIALVLGLTPE
ncbi:MAG TPA: hypothetical protein VE309_08130 [Caulobacteraceae bacterium]|nr:hypothetical protein [Caulobacteraceae bacterium]